MNRKILSMSIASILAAGFMSSASAAETDSKFLKGMEDDTYLTFTGSVAETREDEIDLMVGKDTVTVEVDDEIRDGGAYSLAEGDSITVTGYVNDEFFDGKEVEANAIYVDKIGTTFIVNEDFADGYGMVSGRDFDDHVEINGKVISIDEDDEFRINTGSGEFTVEVDGLDDNPLDDDGYMQLRVGDQINVSGVIDDDWMEGREIEANKVHSVKSSNRSY